MKADTKPTAAPTAETPPKLIPATQWNRFHTWPPLGGLRHLIFHEKTNGFADCVVRCGRKILINEAAFFEWVAQQNQKSASV